MSQKIIVTPGNSYIDIDGLACAIAYAELLRSEKKDAEAVFIGNFNASIPQFLRDIAKSYHHEDLRGDSYVFVDISDTHMIGNYTGTENVIEIYDHHRGFENFWQEKIGEKSKIEPIGAAATLIYEQWKTRGKILEISKESVILLAHAILSNTVNFQLSLSCDRDKEALIELGKIANLAPDWREYYFHEQQYFIENHPRFSIENDIKVGNEPYAFGQIEIWDSKHIQEMVNFQKIFTEIGHANWFLNLVDIQGGFSMILSNQKYLIEKLSEKLNLVPETNSMLIIPKLMLRKEIFPILKS